MGDKKNTNYTWLLSVIIILLIAIMWEIYYFNTNNNISVQTTEKTETKTEEKATKNDVSKTEVKTETPSIVIVTDKRCSKEECNTDSIISQLKQQIPVLANNKIKVIDYSDNNAKKILKETWVKLLPAIIFSNNSINQLKDYLLPTKDWKYSLQVGAKFDPTAKISDKGFKILDKKVLENIKSNSYLKWEKNAKITWLEYSDLECPFCAKLHNSGTPEELEKKYGKKLNNYFQSFPLGFHKNALPGAEALECLGKEKWSDAYYALKHIAYNQKNSDTNFLIDEAVKLWANKDTITKCINNKTFANKINTQQKTWADTFGITGTPGNVLINNETGEYKVISGAYPTSEFEKVIDKLLK